MHELSIAQNIVNAVEKAIKKKRKVKSVLTVELVIGKYHQVIPENISFAYEVASKGTVAEGSKLIMEMLPIKVRCLNCNWEGALNDIWMICENCGETNLTIISGKELYLKNIELEVK
jgi:hydrogenase nickel incorporation protein HypA/HybF